MKKHKMLVLFLAHSRICIRILLLNFLKVGSGKKISATLVVLSNQPPVHNKWGSQYQYVIYIRYTGFPQLLNLPSSKATLADMAVAATLLGSVIPIILPSAAQPASYRNWGTWSTQGRRCQCQSRAVVPDPNESAFIIPPGSRRDKLKNNRKMQEKTSNKCIY